MKEIKDMSYNELMSEIKYIVSIMDDQPYHHAAYLTELADALASKAVEMI